jgi:hypothetical protein
MTTPLELSGSPRNQQGQLLQLIGPSNSQQQQNSGGPSAAGRLEYRPGQSQQGQKLDPAMAQAHCKVLQELMPATKDQRRPAPLSNVIEQLSRIVSETTDPRLQQQRLRPGTSPHQQRPLNQAAQMGYASSLQLLAELVSTSSNSGPVDQASAALTHLCKQFQAHVTSTVREAQLAGQDSGATQQAVYKSGMANQCSTYTKIKLGMTISEQQQPWAVVYYCLRCGDAVAAAEVMQSQHSTAGATDAPVQRILSAMAHTQRDADCIWEVPFPRLAPTDRRAVSDLLESAKHHESPDIHQIGVYSLLSSTGQPVTSETVIGFKAIEDYLTGSLWKALLQASPVDELVKLGKMILEDFGPNYFGDPSTGGWSFALPLLVTQQYQKALTYLADAGGPMGLLQATHIGLILSSAGIIIRNLRPNDSSATPDGSLQSSLLVAYSNLLFSDPGNLGSLAAIEYLVRIPIPKRAHKEVARMIAKTVDIEKLAGTLNAEGMRQGCVIEQYFDSAEISTILGETASILSEDNLL